MKLIDAEKLCEEFKRRQTAALNWKETAIMNDDLEIEIRADAVLGFLSEVKLTIDKAPTVEAYTKDDMTREYLKGYNACKDVNERPTGEWIPVTTRDMTEEEVKELEASGLLDDFDIKDFYDNPTSYWQYNCRLPDDGQEVLVSTKWGVTLTTFYSDVDYGNYFEEYEDRYDVDAWMPLPEPYKKGAEE